MFLGRIHSLPPRTIPTSSSRHTICLPANYFDLSLHSPDRYKITHHIIGSRTPGRQIRLDGREKKCSPSMDWTHAPTKAAVEFENEHGTLG